MHIRASREMLLHQLVFLKQLRFISLINLYNARNARMRASDLWCFHKQLAKKLNF